MNSLIFEALYEYCAKKWNKKAYEYLTDIRKIPDIQIEKFKIFSVDNYFEVNNHLKKNFTLIELQRAGLFNLKEDRSGNFIFYAHRIIIPYQHNNKIVYLRGRYFDEGGSAKANENKYLGLRNDGVGVNTPKRFFNIDVLSTMFKGEKIFMTEGEFDAIIMDAMGRNAIAIPGVGNLPGLDQLKKLEQFDINICADNDQPGQALLEQLKKIFFGMGKNVTVKQLPSKDVNDFWVENISLQVK
jgi:DNA primase